MPTSSTHRPRLLFAIALAALAGCAPSDGGQVGEETVTCQPVERTELTSMELTPIGVGVDDIRSLTEGQHAAPLVWADDSATTIVLTLSAAGTPEYWDREWVDDEGAPGQSQPELGCEDIVAFPFRMHLTTDDGALDESADVVVETSSSGVPSLYYFASAFQGPLDVEAFANSPEGMLQQVGMQATFSAGGPSGSLDALFETTSSAGNDGVASATNFQLGRFAAEAE